MTAPTHPAVQINYLHRSDEEIVGAVQIGAQDPLFEGHYPGLAIVPGVLVIDVVTAIATALTGALQWDISSARFRDLILPPAQLTIRARRDGDGMVAATCSQGPSQVASIRLGQIGR